MPRVLYSVILVSVVFARPYLAAQDVRTAVVFESYSFENLPFSDVSEITIPVGVTLGLGRFGNLALSTGYITVDLTSASDDITDQKISGLLDTQFRLTYNARPGRLVVFANGAVPTGTKTVQRGELAILGAISSDLIGFTSSNVGTGGTVGGGFAGAVPLGRFAIGLGATVKQFLSYVPVVGRNELKPGFEYRVRTGLQGPLDRRTYLRLAGIVAQKAKDVVGDSTRNGIGNRFIGYISINRAVGSSSLTVYAFDVFRSDPQLEATALGTAFLPRGNLFASGVRLDLPLNRVTTLTPRLEYRTSAQAPDAATTSLTRLGSSWRFGANFRRRMGSRSAFVLQLEGLTGSVTLGATESSLSGFKGSVHLELSP